MHCVALVTDMIFETKIRSTAEAVGVDLTTAASTDELRNAMDQHDPGLVLIDLNEVGGSPIEAVALAKAHQSCPYVLAYCSHVQTDLQHAAEQAGADKVWPRSRFAMQLPLLFQDLLDDVQLG